MVALKLVGPASLVDESEIGIKRNPSPEEKQRQASTPINRIVCAPHPLNDSRLPITDYLLPYQPKHYLDNDLPKISAPISVTLNDASGSLRGKSVCCGNIYRGYI